MECHFDALPCTPFCLFEAFHPPGSVSLDSRVASLPYESSSLATSRGNEKYGEEKQRVICFMYHSAVSPFGGERSEPIISMRIMPYDIESQSRNADFNKLAAKPPPQPSGQRPVKLKNLTAQQAGQS